MKKSFFILTLVFLFLLAAAFVSASDVLVWQGQYYTGTTFHTGTYEFNFTVYDALTGGEICYSNLTALTTGSFGEWRTEQSGVSSVCNNISKDYYLNINIAGTDQAPRRRLTVWNYLRKDVDEITTGNLILHGVLQGLSPLKLQDEINFIKSDGSVTSALYNAPRGTTSTLPAVFADSLIHDIIQETNDYGMQECFWDENTETMQMCISGAYLSGRATTISRSLQIVGNMTSKSVDENFTLCEGNNYVDCETDVTGADLLVQDDIEAIGSIFSQENVTANYFIGDGSLLTNLSAGGLTPVYLGSDLTATNAAYATAFTVALTPSKINVVHVYLAQSTTTAGVAVQNRVIVSEAGPVGYCHFVDQTGAGAEAVSNIAVSVDSADTATTTLSLDVNVPFINTIACAVLADSSQKDLIIQFQSETVATVTTYAGSYYTNAVN